MLNEDSYIVNSKLKDDIYNMKFVYSIFWYFHTWGLLLFLILNIFVELWPILLSYTIFFMISNVIFMIYVLDPSSWISRTVLTKLLLITCIIIATASLILAVLFINYWYIGERIPIKDNSLDQYSEFDDKYIWFDYWDHDWDDYTTAIKVFAIILTTVPLLHYIMIVVVWQRRRNLTRIYPKKYFKKAYEDVRIPNSDAREPLIDGEYRDQFSSVNSINKNMSGSSSDSN